MAKTLSLAKEISQLSADGFPQKAIVSDDKMSALSKAFNSQKGVISTPQDELRYIEGLFELPFGYIKEFNVIPKSGNGLCKCGRVLSALDIVYPAVKKRIHDKNLMRDALIGLENIVEIAKDGRQGECISCGRTAIMAGYWTHRYMYA